MNHDLKEIDSYRDENKHPRIKAVCVNCDTIVEYNPNSMKKVEAQSCPPSPKESAIIWVRVPPDFKLAMEQFRVGHHFNFMNTFIVQCVREYMANHPIDDDKGDRTDDVEQNEAETDGNESCFDLIS